MSASDFNVKDGLLGLGQDVLLEVIHQMHSLRDLQNFVGLCNQTFDLTEHPRFLWSTETAGSDITGTKAFILKRAPHVNTVTDPEADDMHKEDVIYSIFDITEQEECPDIESQRILSMGILHKSLRIDSNSSYFAYAILYIDGKNKLHKLPLSMPPEGHEDKHIKQTQEWCDSIKLPPATEKYVRVKTQGSFTIVQTDKGKLYFRGMNSSGTWQESEEFITFAPFNDENGVVQSSLGPSRIKSFYFEDLRQYYILENGAVFLTGCRQDFLSHPEAGNMQGDGLIEITDSTKFKPKYLDCIRGAIPQTEGPYGVFGTFKPVRYYRRMRNFLMEDGTVFLRTYQSTDKTDSFLFSPMDKDKFFNGEKIVTMCHFSREVYVTESGRVLIVAGDRLNDEVEEDLKNPKWTHQVPFSVNRLKKVILPTDSSILYYKDDGRFYRQYNEKVGEEDKPLKEVTEMLTKRSEDKRFPGGMLAKHYCHCGLQYFFLFE
ncbi:hypothetical protein BLNAU_16000 [Blattamonas nauphoetae]|uniref:F-box domain-containing protein n=1 Tax=Blattamonas nauphoetae TaxID=2049346 RepID=A0ABQ9XCW5_9EUKA|nr:hypothetical protein BLNAU_16000 [Blattamonas nauphoetae]